MMHMSTDMDNMFHGEIQHRMVLNALADAIHLVDRNLKIIWANDVYIGWLDNAGVNSDIVGRTVMEAAPFLPDVILDEYCRALDGETILSLESTEIPDGSIVDVETRKIPIIADGDVGGVITVMRDVTEHTRRISELEESENRFKRLLETVGLIAVMLDLDGRITFANEHLLSVSGWTLDEVIGGDWFEMFIPDDIRDTLLSYHNALLVDGRGDVSPHFENQILTKSGELMDVVWDNTVLLDTSGDIVGVASIGMDITKQKAMQEMLVSSEMQCRLTSERLEIVNDSLRDYSKVISHEVRAPLSAISKMGNIVLEDVVELNAPPDCIEFIKRIIEEADSSLSMTDDFLRYAEMETMDVPVGPIDVLDIIRGVVEDISMSSVEVSIDSTIPSVRGDVTLVRQIFRNIIENGVRHNSSEHKVIGVSWHMADGHVVIDVSDNGIGIQDDLRRNMFDPHIRQGGFRGSGMGLAIVRRACDALGIEISVDSEMGGGTTFHLTFPR
jgi:PAS domain S-box-containing protein